MIVTIQGEQVLTQKGTIQINSVLGERSTSSFTVVDMEGNYHFSQYMRVDIKNGNDLIFAGVIDSSKEIKLGNVGLLHKIECVDWHYLADKRTVTKRYDNMKTSEIVKDLIDNYLSYEGITYTYGDKIRRTVAPTFTSKGNISVSGNSLTLVTTQNTGEIPYEETITSSLINTQNTNLYVGSEIFWSEHIPKGTGIKVEVSIDNKVSWHEVYNNSPIPMLEYQQNTNLIKLYCRVTLYTNNFGSVVPSISNIKIKFIDVFGSISEGVDTEVVVFNYTPISQAMNRLAEITGFWWDIDINKQLRFTKRTTNIAPFNINENTIVRDSLDVTIGNNKYRNHQYVLGGKDETDLQFETFVGNGNQQTFTVGYPITKVPTIKLDGVQQSVGIKGLDDKENTSIQWFWSKGDSTITQNSEHAPITNSQRLTIDYIGEFSISILTRNLDSTVEIKVLDGSSGIVESVYDDKSLTTRESAVQSAQRILEQHGKQGKSVKFRTWKSGLKVGQIVRVTFGIHDVVNLECLINDISISVVDDFVEYDVTAIYNLSDTSWIKFFYEIAGRNRLSNIYDGIGEDEILVMVENYEKTWSQLEYPNIFKSIFPSSTLFPSSTTFPSFNYENRLRYVSLFNGNTEIFRKAITREELSVNGKVIYTISQINSNEGNTTFTHIGWFGGDTATTTRGTGILIDKQPINIKKTKNIAIQVYRTDMKGW